MKNRGKGDKYTAPSPIEDGLSDRESMDHSVKLRGETNLESQRPTATTKTLKDDQGRGSFKSKC